ncbi:putative Ser/Thr protein kinase-like protein [Rhodovulum sp. P5]|uniref:aminoglycoside phosphotransferase family protein n=1 Tax=Rhodovulum sp. P5 TaxID=1564506 RepID=UPI0009C3AF0A|nr:phosphotransferase [Rhodovulum sp. P5]ARE40586.1 putative Ser/Thr protein kinase-like protein [Rhodovulum sp. P5]
MPDRAALRDAFLSRAGWGGAVRRPLAGDASNRRYDRLTGGPGGAGAVLMDAAPEKGEDVRPFVAIARHLSGLGLSAPRILADDPDHGFLLLEDLGDDLFARVAKQAPDMEPPLYEAAVDVLAALHSAPLPAGLAAYDAPLMADLACLPFDWYIPALDRPAPDDERAAFRDAIKRRLAALPDDPVLVLRDYHAENLLWLPDRAGIARVGLLDFQDAMTGHRAYDLVSLLEDARRDVPEDLQARMRARYVAAAGIDAGAFDAAYALMGAQRNLRILGVFARLCVRDGKPGYLPMMGRVWGHLMRDLAHPSMADLQERVIRLLPPPDPDILDRIASRCAPTR